MAMPPLFDYQQKGVERWLATPGMLNLSDPGTGKTRTTLEGIVQRNSGGRTLVLAPLSILKPAWGDDIKKWTPSLSFSIAYADCRMKAFKAKTDVVITNHDAVKWILDNPTVLEGFDTLVIDEFTAFKNPTAQRTKAVIKLSERFTFRYLLSGTPNPRSITDLWAPAYIVDGGERLGKLFHKFRAEVCYAVAIPGAPPGALKWKDRTNGQDMVMAMLDDIIYRVPLSGLPDNTEYTMYVDLPKPLMRQYRELQKESILMMESGNSINALHAGTRIRKMLQLLTGAVYDERGNVQQFHTNRYELVMSLVAERPQSVVAFNWRHERENLVKLAQSMDITYGVIDGETPVKDREAIVDKFQAGELQVIFAHPQSAGHGLTLTAGHATIWCSPTYNAEHYQQFNRRIYRTGQTKRTETIRIAARDTCELEVYENLDGKLVSMEQLLLTALQITNAA